MALDCAYVWFALSYVAKRKTIRMYIPIFHLHVCMVSNTYGKCVKGFRILANTHTKRGRCNEVETKWNGTSCQYCLLSFVELAFPLVPVSYKCEQMCQIVQHLKVQLVLLLPLQLTQAQFLLLSMYFYMYGD